MKKTLSIFIAALTLLGCGISVIAFEKGFAAEVADVEICELIDNLAEYHSRQFVENVTTCEIITKQRVAEDLAVRQSCIIDMQKRIGAYFTNASVKIENMKITPIKNGFEVNYDELTVLDYKYPSSAQTDSLEFSITHKVILSRNLEILSDEFSEEMVTGFSNCEIVAENFSDNSTTNTISDSSTFNSMKYTYNAQSAITYADTYATTYNSDYPSSSSDCTNFVSQCLHAGGIPFINVGSYNSGWYVDFPSMSFSKSWGRASSFVSFWTDRGYSSSPANGSDAKMGNCIPGNPVYWLNTGGSYSGHLMICTCYNSTHIPCINAHTSNVLHMPITNYSDKTLKTIEIVSCSHAYATYSSFGNIKHVIICSNCNNHRLENHTWANYSNYIKCIYCNRIIYLS